MFLMIFLMFLMIFLMFLMIFLMFLMILLVFLKIFLVFVMILLMFLMIFLVFLMISLVAITFSIVPKISLIFGCVFLMLTILCPKQNSLLFDIKYSQSRTKNQMRHLCQNDCHVKKYFF